METEHPDTVNEFHNRSRSRHPFDEMITEAATAARYVDQAKLLADVSGAAAALSDIFTREASGARDGDGTWHGSDAMHYALHELEPRLHELAELYRAAVRLQAEPAAEPF